MTFIALIIALALLQYWGSASPVHHDDWFAETVKTVAGWGMMPELQLAVAVLGPALLLYWVESWLAGWFFGLPMIALMALVLLYSFGRGDFEALVNRYREYSRQADFQGAYLFAQEELERPGEAEGCPSSPEHLHRWMKQRIIYAGFERWFGVIFYFALLGAPAALAYRLLQLYCEYTEDPVQKSMVHRIDYWVDWLPSRLLILAFAVTGDWVGSREQVMTSIQDLETPTGEVLSDAAHAALGLKATVYAPDSGDNTAFAEISDWEVGELQSLLSRSAVAWVVVLSVLVLFL